MLAEQCVAIRIQFVEVLLDKLFRFLDMASGILPVKRVEALSSKRIAHILHVLLATRLFIAFTIWRTHVSRILADDVGNSTFSFGHLKLAVLTLQSV